ncbi:LamG-like jellyroll fold domain-containing protein [Roseibacillus persicicus]|uniref:PEP-CTERM protein-sorting domain-containing protein n=1 Tax=Roseibacillus persicicus TaxID=454148 RepID=A0A918TWW6_9BACT|nr:LamG-like jellyroll fold domain-containing protein [Roseibacillus persicicus]GHC66799.1 hypothetical protein GCM10007100_38360 [Roseibacillus persicicus]
MKPNHTLSGVILSNLLLLASSPLAHSAVVEYWDFENGTAGPLTPAGEPSGSGYAEGLNGNRIHGWDSAGGAGYTTDTSPNGGALGLSSANQDGYIFSGDTGETLLGWTSPNWTLEMHARIDDLNGWETLFARMGSSYGAAESDLYFQRRGDQGANGQFRLNYVPNMSGSATNADRLVLNSTISLTQSTWYGIAVSADSTTGTISMFIDDGSGYALDSQLTGLSGDLGVTPGTDNYAFFRDYYNGGQSNNTTGVIDNVRFSDSALEAGDLIPLAIPEPTSSLLGSFGLLALLRRRR